MKIAISILVALFFIGCGDDSVESAYEDINPQDIQSAIEKPEPSDANETKETVNKVIEATKEAKKVVHEVSKEAESPVTIVSVTGEGVFKTCATCHGATAEKSALGKSQIIKGWESAKIMKALNGYKTDTYGGSMKGLMKGQAAKLSDEEMKAVAGYISKL
ncbi:MAG: c-type cytochrome [Campylobacterales bacterium]|nr:c-type cytochrome [Campylobacterales bacterium]